ncbi:MAG TPA: aminotransferase class III-fold pyridoxal phosphate-dependent enzyme [Blastocatellia bacterium]|nr:aminotransferase class III-fold pyridoxal phosphate-dependent enzyme [Blastocatellia bacterium]
MPTSLDAVVEFEEKYQVPTYKKFPLAVERGEDVWVYTSDGERYLDLYGGHAVVSTGHCHPRIVAAIKNQAEKMIFYSNLVYSQVRAEASEKLVGIAPKEFAKTFFVNSGTEANENAVKLARMRTGRQSIVGFEGGFHGRTLGSLAVTGIKKYQDLLEPKIGYHYFAEFGNIDSVLKLPASEIAGIILEPIQSMGGVNLAPPEFYKELREYCDRTGALLIYDEVQTGFGRTGEYFFAGRYDVTPDIITTAKGIASGVPMGAVLVQEELAKTIKYGDLGTTFGGGMLACAALSATIDVIKDEHLLQNVRGGSQYLFERLRELPFVTEVRGLGYLVGIRFQQDASHYQKGLLDRKIITGMADDKKTLRLLPPLTLKRKEIDLFLQALTEIG